MDETFLTVAEIADQLQLNQQTVRNWIDRGELAAIRLGARRVRVRASEFERFIAASSSAGLPDEATARREFDEELDVVPAPDARQPPQAFMHALLLHCALTQPAVI
jgi:excisionase family DNA binding protein